MSHKYFIVLFLIFVVSELILCKPNNIRSVSTNRTTIYPEDVGILPHDFLRRTFKHFKLIIKHLLFLDSNVPIERDVTFHLITRLNINSPKQLLINNRRNLIRSPMSKSKRTIFIIHGWCDDSEHETFRQMQTELLKNSDINIIMVDWRHLSGQFYPVAAQNIYRVAKFLKKFLLYLNSLKYIRIEKLHFIGHSLGAQISGIIGQYFNGKIARITGLDPAGPLFEFGLFSLSNHLRLDSSDAQFVDVIHTASGMFGVINSVGHVDFYPNYGIVPQPGCNSILSTVSCSHVRATQYLTESINSQIGFWATYCSTWFYYIFGFCANNSQILMGYWTPKVARGNYFLKTNQRSPYAQKK